MHAPGDLAIAAYYGRYASINVLTGGAHVRIVAGITNNPSAERRPQPARCTPM